GGISGYAQLMLEEEQDPEKAESLRRIMDEVQRCDRIVGDLLSFARRHPPERREIDVGQVLQDTLELRQRQLHSWGLRTQVDISPYLPRLHGDPHQLQQVFLNIVINAEQALRDRGESLHITAGTAVPSTRRPDGETWVAITFYNDGPPIPPEVLPRIFQPFFKTQDADEGTGLGLSICQWVVPQHGGGAVVE